MARRAAAAAAAVLGLLASPAHTTAVTRTGLEDDGIDKVDVAGLKQTLDSGGAEALAKMLATMKATQSMKAPVDHDKQFHIRRRGGQAIYDFSDPVTTTTKAPPTPTISPALLAKFPFMAKTAPAGKLPAGTAPVAVALAAAAPPMMQQSPMQPASPTFLMSAGAQAQSANQMQALTRGLETIREKIDSLAEEAVASVQGSTMQLPQSSMPAGMPAAAAQVQQGAAAASAAVSDKVEKELEALAKRVSGLEQDNHDLHGRIKKEDGQLKADELAAAKAREQIAALAKDNEALKANVTQLSAHRRLRLRKGARPAAAKVVKL